MVYIDAIDQTLDAIVKRYCAPLFATDQFLRSGHTATSINATVTFVKFESRMYAVTCHHVLSAFFREAVTKQLRVVPSIHAGLSIRQLGSFGPDGAYRWSIASCRDLPSTDDIGNPEALAALDRKNAGRPDIAIADLTDIWPDFSEQRDAAAIDLDAWVEPEWETAQPVWLAFGFPDAHKYEIGNKVAAPFPRVTAKLESSRPSPDKPTYTLCSTLHTAHGFGFSGLSGGPVLTAHTTKDRFAFVGITFEGAPSSKDIEKNPEAFVGAKDIILMGYHLTPQAFRFWLSQRQSGIEIN
jgi:hypothetical protein